MTSPRLPLCIFNRHQPDRSKIAWDDFHYGYVSECRYCRETVVRKAPRRWTRPIRRKQALAG